ncbi:hypothetical protein KSC_044460 [Ktedonobacter sp. SOSP1-52]|uniref:helix-turn-helix domain-containing protein n=1 Tax=Ktedonobacter sp. SOSP1-52 TaxID=2778366 RepID=UPI0019157785|nr:helix-turn-helix domain-containing protein [Ktedonobacter sp. SOSP1-52]GHO65554.1 hypothetical protein KSC_044460 [Ktedonobacter sp. SOSP1-52]
MKDVFPLPDLPGYVDIKEAARILGVAESSIYRYVQSGRLSAFQAGRNIMIEAKSLEQFKPTITGRPRKRNALWHTSPDANAFLVTYIRVNVKENKQELLKQILSTFRQDERFLFPGTVVRYISLDETSPLSVTIQFVWKQTDMPTQEIQEQELAGFKVELGEVLDWNTAQYINGTVLIHT